MSFLSQSYNIIPHSGFVVTILKSYHEELLLYVTIRTSKTPAINPAPCTTSSCRWYANYHITFTDCYKTIPHIPIIGNVSKETLGKLLRDGVERMWAFPSA